MSGWVDANVDGVEGLQGCIVDGSDGGFHSGWHDGMACELALELILSLGHDS